MKILNTDKAPKALGPYSQAILVENTLFTSGQIGIDPISGNVDGDNIKSQTERVILNLKAVLESASMDFSHVIKTTCFLKNIEDFNEFNSIYAQHFISKPARSTVEVARLPKDVLVEIELIAKKPKNK